MSSPESEAISHNPAIQELQLVQFAAELEQHRHNKKIVALARLQELPLNELLDRFFEVDTGLAVAKSPDKADTVRLVYDHGIRFTGRAQSIGFMDDPNVPVASVFIGFREPRVVADMELIDEDVENELYSSAAPAVTRIMAPILAIRACSVELPKAA